MGGNLGLADTLDPRSGFGTAEVSNYLYAFGGQRAAPSAGGVSSEITGPPDLDNWNNLGTSMSESRYLPGSAQESAVIFVLGGETDTSAATNTVDYTNF